MLMTRSPLRRLALQAWRLMLMMRGSSGVWSCKPDSNAHDARALRRLALHGLAPDAHDARALRRLAPATFGLAGLAPDAQHARPLQRFALQA